jgi:hypothetical protein
MCGRTGVWTQDFKLAKLAHLSPVLFHFVLFYFTSFPLCEGSKVLWHCQDSLSFFFFYKRWKFLEPFIHGIDCRYNPLNFCFQVGRCNIICILAFAFYSRKRFSWDLSLCIHLTHAIQWYLLVKICWHQPKWRSHFFSAYYRKCFSVVGKKLNLFSTLLNSLK